ncbi:MAG: phosphopantetheine-binding protein, partial [Ornithinimicrobium sp.]
EADTDLESELGVDSVKQTELLARVAEVFQMPARPDGFRAGDFGTLSKVTDLVLSQSIGADIGPAKSEAAA